MRVAGSALAAFAAGGLLALVSAGPAAAFDRTAAASYADFWWTNRNSQYPGFSDDCTNFVSQALHAGGIRFRQADFSWSGSYGNTAYWVAQGGLNDYWTTTWSVAHTNASWVNGLANGRQTAVPATKEGTQTPLGYQKRGNTVYYDWDGDGSINHAGIIVDPSGTSSDGTGSGTLTDQHVTDRYHTRWDLKKYNGSWATTVYYVDYVDDSAT